MNNQDKTAFPIFDKKGFASPLDQENGQTGLTKQEYFKGKALQGLLSNQWFIKKIFDEQTEKHGKMADNRNEEITEVLSTWANNFATQLMRKTT